MSAKPLDLPLADEAIAAHLETLPGWAYAAGALEKTFEFGSFREAMGFMTRVAFEAEELDHHPEWSNVYNRVKVRLLTHHAGDRVTQKDVDLAARIQRISWVG